MLQTGATRAMVIGGYGFIGAEAMRALADAGLEVIGLGRDAAFGARLIPQTEWRQADLATLLTPAAWQPLLEDIDIVVNASGALQNAPGTSLERIQSTAIRACIEAAETAGVRRFVQISAVGASEDASTAFLRTKARGDAAVRASSLDWTILRPGLVIGSNAYGGTALLRMLAGVPGVQALVLADAQIQTVAMRDVTHAIVRAATGQTPARAQYDLVEPEVHSLSHVVGALRRRLGFTEPLIKLSLPLWLGHLFALGADLAGWLGWRPALRSTALVTLSEGIRGNAEPWEAATGRRLSNLQQTLADLPATLQERTFARVQLLLPLLVVTLSVFWIGTGIIALLRIDEAAAQLAGVVTASLASALVVGGSLVDIVIGGALLVRRWTRAAAVASAAVAAFYLMLGTALVPLLWLDPLGAYLKVLPCIVASAALALLLERR